MSSTDVPTVAYKAADFIEGVRYLTPAENLAYRQICDHIYDSGDRLEDDDAMLRVISCVGSRWKRVKDALIRKGKLFVEGGIISNQRCRAEIRKARDRKRKAHRGAETLHAQTPSEQGQNTENTPAQTQFEQGANHVITPAPAPPESQELDTSSSESSVEEALNPSGAKAPSGERARRATRLGIDFKMPQEWIGEGYAARKRHDLAEADLDLEAEKFSNYWRAKAGEAGRKLDWHGTWINWCLKAETRHAAGSGANGTKRTLSYAEIGAAFDAGDATGNIPRS